MNCAKITKCMQIAGRVLLGGFFIMAGAGKMMDISGTAFMIDSVGFPLPVVLAWVTALLLIGLGGMVVVGFHAKEAAVGLALFTILVSVLYHGPGTWDELVQQLMFMKNMAITGGLLYIAAREKCSCKMCMSGGGAAMPQN